MLELLMLEGRGSLHQDFSERGGRRRVRLGLGECARRKT